MEHRCSRRIPLNINTLVYRYGVPVAMGRIKNGSHQGLYLETDYQEVRTLQKLELEMLLGQRIKGSRRCHINALVVRKTECGYGLELEVLEGSSSPALQEFIRQRQLDHDDFWRTRRELAHARVAAVHHGGQKRRRPCPQEASGAE